MVARKEYAARYDAMAQRLYQIAVYLTGDALEARRAIAACFVSGYDAASKGEAPFEAAMLRALCHCCGESQVLQGESYCQRLHETLAVPPDGRLCGLLRDLEPWRREVILLVMLGGAAVESLHRLIDCDPVETAETLQQFCREARLGKGLCRA